MTNKNIIHHITVPHQGNDLFVTAEFEKNVSLWSLQDKAKLNDINTVLSYGGNRLAILLTSSPVIVAGSWDDGVQAYDGISKNILWTRNDLREVQYVIDISNQKLQRVGVIAENNIFYLLNGETGKEIEKINKIETLFRSPLMPFYLTSYKQKVSLLNPHFELVWQKPMNSFSLLNAAFSENQIVYSEAGGSVYCNDLSGNQIWFFKPENDWHVIHLVWNPISQSWFAVNKDCNSPDSLQLFEVKINGDVRLKFDIKAYEVAFFPNGEYLITSNGSIISTCSGNVEWRFV